MAKKNLIKSTTQKKADTKSEEETATKKKPAKKATKKAAKTTKKPAAKTAKKSSAAKKKAAPAAKKTAAKKAAPKKAAAKKPAATKAKAKAAPKKAKATKKVSVKELVFKKFEPTGALPKPMPAPKPAAVDISAPPFISSSDPKEVERVRALLFNQFDMKAIKAAAKAAPKAVKVAPKKSKTTKKVSVKELVFKKFEPTGTLSKPMPAPKPAAVDVSAPPFVSGSDPKEVERIRALLFNQFDMKAIKAAAKAPAPADEPAPAAETEAPQGTAKVITAADAQAPEADNAYISVEPPTSTSTDDPMNRMIKMAVAAAAAIVLLILAISYNNSLKYYIYPKDDAIEIWKGEFSPKGKAFFMVLHGVPAVEPAKAVYTQKDVFPLVFTYFIDKADTLLEVPGLPDFEGIKTYLHKAQGYAIGQEMHTAVTTRLNNIERMTLLYKADVAISKDNEDALQSAIGLLKKAATLTPSPAQANEIAQKIEQARARLVELRSADSTETGTATGTGTGTE
jgi:colicin import membrane protein